MNKYIKKCLVIYSSLALILVGMVGVTYAITATDAYNYVTRSQYAVDMAHLQNKLDEKEAGLMGNINRYRSTDVKFVTYDTPDHYNTVAAFAGTSRGYHNGGNYFIRSRVDSSGWQFFHPWNDNSYGKQYAPSYSIFKIWNGNYFITKNLFYVEENTSPTPTYYHGVNWAVPVEDLPGWYLVIFTYQMDNATRPWVSLVKLDPNVPMPNITGLNAIINTEHTVRLKKNLFKYAGDNTAKLPTTMPAPTSNDISFQKIGDGQTNSRTIFPFSYTYISTESSFGTRTIYHRSWVDAETGDYMFSFRNLVPCGWSGGGTLETAATFTYITGTSFPAICRLIPVDNVEYVMGNSYGNYVTYYAPNANYSYPPAEAIGTGTHTDPYWRYEFVDGVNGIKYWHAYKYPTTEQQGTTTGRVRSPFGIHYSLPIVY